MTPGERLLLPGTDLRISRLCLGGNKFGGVLDQAESFAVLDAFVEAGGNFLDTAHVYADWIPGNIRSSSETCIGRWLRDRRPRDIVIATKGGHPPLAEPALKRLDRQALRQDVTESLALLNVERLDLFYLHRDDPGREAAEILGTLEDFVGEGLIRAYAASNWALPRLQQAARAAEANGWPGFAANQAEWSLAERNAKTIPADLVTMDAAMIGWHRERDWMAIPYSAQAKGYFDKLAAAPASDAPAMRLYDNAASRARAALLGGIAEEVGAMPTQVALAALMAAPFPTVPVIGCGSPEQVRASMASLSVRLSEEQRAALAGSLPWLEERRG